MNRNKPNFLIVGANKGGTTSLFHYLTEHPEVFRPDIKEPMFFNYYQCQEEDGNFRTQKVIKNIASYHKLFEGSEAFKAVGEASTSYLANPFCAAHIYDYNPKMKLIAILRNPIDRAFSNYLMYVRWGQEKRSFTKAVRDELNGRDLPQGKQYIYLGHYLESLETYQNIFGKEQLLVLLNEDLNKNPETTYRTICRYLEIDEEFVPNFNKRLNTNDKVEIRPAYKLLKSINAKWHITKLIPKSLKRGIQKKPGMNAKDRALLTSIYKDEIMELSKFLNRDLSHWLS